MTNNPINITDPTGYQGGLVVCFGIAFLIPDPFFIEEGICTLIAIGTIAAVAAPVAIQAMPDDGVEVPSVTVPRPNFPPGQPVPVPAPKAPPLPIPEGGYVSPEEAAQLRRLYYGEPVPESTPEPIPAPQPVRPDPFVPPCPTDTPEPKWYLYHYTGDAGLAGILATRMIWASTRDPENPKSDAQWGDGQYFTDISPQDASSGSAHQLSRALFTTPWKYKSVQNWVRVNVAGLPMKRVSPVFSHTFGNKSIYLHPNPGPLNVMNRLEGWGATPFAR